MSPSEQSPYEVHLSSRIARQLQDLHRSALGSGRGDIVLFSFGAALLRMRTNPNDFGEETYRLPALRLQIRCAVVPPLIVHFGVCEDRPIVYVKGVESLGE